MPVVEIDSLEDERIAPYRQLKKNNATRWSGLFVAEGDKLLERLAASRFPIVSLLLGNNQVERFAPLAPPTAPVYVLPEARIESLVGFNFHRGVLALGRRRPGPDAGEVASLVGPRRVVVLPELHDAENLGLIIRTATALSVDAVMLGPLCADPYSRRVLRTSMGAALRTPIVESHEIPADLDRLRAGGYTLVATVAQVGAGRTSAVVPLAKSRRPERLALLVGSEGHGLSEDALSRCDERVTIPMSPGVDSLNVSVATGIALYHYSSEDRDEASPSHAR